VTVAVLITEPVPLAVPETVIDTELPAGSVASVAVTLLPATFTVGHTAPPEAPVQLAETPLTPAGTASAKVAPLAASGPALVIVIE
jgi:hypothetical protein